MTSLSDLPAWPWPADAGELERLQSGLAGLAGAVPAWESPGAASAAGVGTVALPADLMIAGVYVTYPSDVGGPGDAGEPMSAAAVLGRGGEVAVGAVERGQTGAAYVAGLLALSCGPLLERAVRALPGPGARRVRRGGRPVVPNAHGDRL